MTFEDFAPHTIHCLHFFVVAIDLLFAVAVEINNYTINAVYINNLKHYIYSRLPHFRGRLLVNYFMKKWIFVFAHIIYSARISVYSRARSLLKMWNIKTFLNAIWQNIPTLILNKTDGQTQY